MSKRHHRCIGNSDVEVLHVGICKTNYVQCKYPNMYMYALYCVYTHGNDSSIVMQHNHICHQCQSHLSNQVVIGMFPG